MTDKKRDTQYPKLRKGENSIVAEMTGYSVQLVVMVLSGQRKNDKILDAARKVERNRNKLLTQ